MRISGGGVEEFCVIESFGSILLCSGLVHAYDLGTQIVQVQKEEAQEAVDSCCPPLTTRLSMATLRDSGMDYPDDNGKPSESKVCSANVPDAISGGVCRVPKVRVLLEP
eukprot:gene10802-biopygen7466